MQTISDIAVAGKRVLCRVDLNVPLDDNQQIKDDARIRAVVPTLKHILAQGGRLVIASHLGRPKGARVPAFSLKPVADRLAMLLETPVEMADDCVGPVVEALVEKMQPGQVVLLENLRFHPEEQQNADDFAQRLASLCDVYVNDAFAVSHRKNASVEAIVRHAPVAVAGMLLAREIAYFEKAMARPQRPLAAVVGGAKVSSKLAALRNLLSQVDKVVIGGAMANTFLKAQGVSVGGSKIEADLVGAAGDLLRTAAERGTRFYLPVDAVVAPTCDAHAVTKIVPVQDVPDDWMMLDIGPATAIVYRQALADAKTIIWNGPMGVFEMDAFSRGTMAMAAAVADAHALTIVGGGDTDAALHQAGETDRVGYVSTGGGAFLTLLEGTSLPGVAALEAVRAA